MDLHAWKAAAREKLEALAAEGRAGMPAVLYGGLSAATIFPLVEATSQAAGQSDVAALMALGGLASNVGAILWPNRSAAGATKANKKSARNWTQAQNPTLNGALHWTRC